MDALSARRRGVGRASDGHGRGTAEEESALLAVRGWLGVRLRGSWQKRHGSVRWWLGAHRARSSALRTRAAARIPRESRGWSGGLGRDRPRRLRTWRPRAGRS